MALNANALLTLNEARAELRETTQAYDAIIERRINALSTTFESLTGLVLAGREVEDYRVDGNGCAILYLPIIPVQSVERIEVRYHSDETQYFETTNPADYLLKDPDTGMLQLLNYKRFICGLRNVLLDMTIGFAAGHEKLAEAQRLLVMQLSYEYQRWQRNEAGLLSRTLNDGSVSFAPPTNLLKEVQDGLLTMKIARI
jgi:uncharacterized phiE125 gp8 family phage protein